MPKPAATKSRTATSVATSAARKSAAKPVVKKPVAKKPSTRAGTKKPASRKSNPVQEEKLDVIEQKADGTRLIRAINQRMAVLGMSPVDVAGAFDMSYSYFITLANNPSRFAGIDRRFMRNIARFLGINTIMAYQYAGFFEDEDVNVEVTVDALLSKARDAIELDPVYGFYIPQSEAWNALPLKVRLLMHFMYNEIDALRPKVLLSVEQSGKTGGRHGTS